VKDSIHNKLQTTRERLEEIAGLMADPDVIGDQNQFRDLGMEYAKLEPIVGLFRKYESLVEEITATREMARDSDEEVRKMGEEELASLEEQRASLELELKKALIPPDPHDDSNVYLEIRAGTGGDEAAIFAGDLFRMYSKYAEAMKWPIEIISSREGEHGGYKEIVSRVTGSGIYAKLKFESGAHRVQRVPATESQGRIHTSACTVAVLAEPDELEEIEVNTNDLRVDTFRASGAGGQHVNKTDSAVRLTHLLNARTSGRSTRTVPGRCHCSRQSFWTRKSRNERRNRRNKENCWSDREIGRNASALIIIRKAGSPTIASISPYTSSPRYWKATSTRS
jgi:peptide chain release factor 1